METMLQVQEASPRVMMSCKIVGKKKNKHKRKNSEKVNKI